VIGQVVFTRTSILGTVVVSLLLAIRPIRRLLRTEPSSWKIKIDVIPATVIILVLLVTAIGGLAEIVGDGRTMPLRTTCSDRRSGSEMESSVRYPITAYRLPCRCRGFLWGTYVHWRESRAWFFAVATLAVFFLIAYSVAIRAGLEQQKAWWVVALLQPCRRSTLADIAPSSDALYAGFLLVAACVGLQRSFAVQAILFGLFCGFAMATNILG